MPPQTIDQKKDHYDKDQGSSSGDDELDLAAMNVTRLQKTLSQANYQNPLPGMSKAQRDSLFGRQCLLTLQSMKRSMQSN